MSTVDERPGPPTVSSAVGAAASVAGASASLLALAIVHAFRSDVPFPPIAVAETILRLAPGAIATLAIEALGHLAQPLLVLSTTAAFLAITWWLGRALPRVAAATRGGVPVAATVLGLPLALVGLLAFAPNTASIGRGGYALVLLFGLLVGAAVTTWRHRRLIDRQPIQPEALAAAPGYARREVIRSAWVAGASLALAWTGLGRTVFGRERPEARLLRVEVREAFPHGAPAGPSFDGIEGLAPRLTPVPDFYTIDTALFDPVVDEERWALEVGGLVDRPFAMPYDELLAQDAIGFHSTLVCISNEVGGDLISTGRWTGVSLRSLLERSGVGDGAVEVVATSVDGYADSIPLEDAMRETSIVAYGLEGRPLPTAHGFPARLLVPGRYGMKQPKWLASIELVDRPFEGYWEQRGWSKAAIVKTMSRIDAAVAEEQGRLVAGVAFAGDRGISRVEVSTDGGGTWEDAELEPALSPLTWRRWRYRFLGPSEGGAVVVVRGTDGENRTQTQVVTPPHPDGASGYDAVQI